jgi:hypothetical protein
VLRQEGNRPGGEEVVEIERDFIKEMSIQDFADAHDLVMQVIERDDRHFPIGNPSHFLAHFKGVEIGGGGLLRGVYGNGATEEEAIRAYAPEISLKNIVVDAMSSKRREIRVPRLFYGEAKK